MTRVYSTKLTQCTCFSARFRLTTDLMHQLAISCKWVFFCSIVSKRLVNKITPQLNKSPFDSDQFSVIMVSMCLPSDPLPQHLPSYLGFSYVGRGVSLHGCSSKVQLILLTLDDGYLLTAAPPDLEHVGDKKRSVGAQSCTIASSGVPDPWQILQQQALMLITIDNLKSLKEDLVKPLDYIETQLRWPNMENMRPELMMDRVSSVTSLSPDLSSAQFSVNLNPATHG